MFSIRLAFGLGLALAAPVFGQSPDKPWQHEDGTIEFEGRTFDDWKQFHRSDLSDPLNKCGTPTPGLDGKGGGGQPIGRFGGGGSPADCTMSSTSIDPVYDPEISIFRIPCVVHVIMNSSGSQGNLSDAQVESGIRILNEDMNALLDTPGENGTEARIEFYLATEDQNGSPTDGITRSQNDSWFNDGGNYWNSLAWDPNRFCNIYTNTASGALGYVSGFPAEPGHAGSPGDRVVVLWSTYGEDGSYGPPFNMGRTLTHEIGHYLGLFHTFQGGCAGGSCYGGGDLICDTNSESGPNFGCGTGSSCGSPDPTDNYMDYSDDACMNKFTAEQSNRMRCSLLNYRPLLYSEGPGCSSACFADISNDGQVDSADIGLLIGSWGACSDDDENPCCADLDGSGAVDSADLGLMIGGWGPCPVDPCEGVDCNDGDPCTTDSCLDGTCFNEPIPGCGEGPCGIPGSGSCYIANGSPGCDDSECCEGVCAADAYCCNTEWDSLCSSMANSQCSGGSGGGGSCCSPNGSPGCDDAECQNLVCNLDPFCCDNDWDQICADEAVSSCEVCNN